MATILVTNTSRRPRRLSYRMPNGKINRFELPPRAKEVKITIPDDSVNSFKKQQEILTTGNNPAIIIGKTTDSKARNISEANEKDTQEKTSKLVNSKISEITDKAEELGVKIEVQEEKSKETAATKETATTKKQGSVKLT